MPRDYHEQPAEAYAASAEPLPTDFSFNSSESPPDPDFKETGGRFRKGHDPRRHTFTPEECSAGFWAGLASYVEQGARRATSCAARGRPGAGATRYTEERTRPTAEGRIVNIGAGLRGLTPIFLVGLVPKKILTPRPVCV